MNIIEYSHLPVPNEIYTFIDTNYNFNADSRYIYSKDKLNDYFSIPFKIVTLNFNNELIGLIIMTLLEKNVYYFNFLCIKKEYRGHNLVFYLLNYIRTKYNSNFTFLTQKYIKYLLPYYTIQFQTFDTSNIINHFTIPISNIPFSNSNFSNYKQIDYIINTELYKYYFIFYILNYSLLMYYIIDYKGNVIIYILPNNYMLNNIILNNIYLKLKIQFKRKNIKLINCNIINFSKTNTKSKSNLYYFYSFPNLINNFLFF